MENSRLARTRSEVLLLPALLSVLLIVGSCGGGGKHGGGGPTPLSVLAPPVKLESGIMLETGSDTLNTSVGVGDNALNQGVRGFMAFDITGVPAGATIVAATLRLDQYATTGGPYALGGVVVDHVSGMSFNGLTLTGDLGIVSADATTGLKSIDVTAQVAADIGAASTRTYFRLRFPTLSDIDGTLDAAWFSTDTPPAGPESFVEISYLP